MNRKLHPRWLIPVLAAVMVAAFSFGTGGLREDPSFSAAESLKLIDQRRGNDRFIILDVRTPAEFAKGHIAGAFLLDFHAPGFQQALQGLDRDKAYLIYCRSGNRSGKTLAMTDRLGFSKVYHMANGILEWQAAGFPLVSGQP